MNSFDRELAKIQQDMEEKTFCAQAAFSVQSKGRLFPISPEKEDFRSPYARDRDRIIHSSSFRRLKDKAQVFLLSQNDMIRTRLTHTLEVSQISRTISRALQLNEDLTEAIALGHDLGHTPFGHVGERALSELCQEWFPKPLGKDLDEVDFLGEGYAWVQNLFTSYRHNVQSLRVVDLLENKGRGLNLTYEVREGILYHSKWGGKLNAPEEKYLAKTFEGQIVRIADRVAYVNHDLQDAIRSEMIRLSDIPKEVLEGLGQTHSERISRAVTSIVKYFLEFGKIGIDEELAQYIDKLYEILKEKVYQESMMNEESKKARFIIRELAFFYKDHPDLLEKKAEEDCYEVVVPLERKIIDYIANMTDHFALREFQLLRLPKEWAGGF